MENTRLLMRYTLCFLTRGDDLLMLHRHKPPNQGLWNGVGGHIETGETPQQSVLREVREETGYHLTTARFAGILTWEGFETPAGGLYIFTAPAPSGEPLLCNEGVLAWKPRAWVFSSPEVVSNIHVFGPYIFNACAPMAFHFVYQGGEYIRYDIRPYNESDVVNAAHIVSEDGYPGRGEPAGF